MISLDSKSNRRKLFFSIILISLFSNYSFAFQNAEHQVKGSSKIDRKIVEYFLFKSTPESKLLAQMPCNARIKFKDNVIEELELTGVAQTMSDNKSFGGAMGSNSFVPGLLAINISIKDFNRSINHEVHTSSWSDDYVVAIIAPNGPFRYLESPGKTSVSVRVKNSKVLQIGFSQFGILNQSRAILSFACNLPE